MFRYLGDGDKDLDAMIEAEVNEGGPAPPASGAEPSPVAQSGSSSSQERSKTMPCPAPDEVLRLPLGANLDGAKSKTLLKTNGLELIRMVIPAGMDIPLHEAPSELTVQCLEGCVSFTRNCSTKELRAGELLHLCPGEPHSVKGLENASLLLTLRLPNEGPLPALAE
jgi:quercetin dioxygenase-like cupin family protein